MQVDCQDFTTIQVDLIQMDEYLVDSCAISPIGFLFYIFYYSFLLSLKNIFVKIWMSFKS